MTKMLIPVTPDFGELDKTHFDFHKAQYQQNRQSILSEIRCITGIPEIIRSFKHDTLYKLVLPEGKILQQSKDGLFRGVFYGDKGIDTHAKFIEVPPSLVDVVKTVGSQVLLISIAMQLDRIEKAIEKISQEMHRDRIAEVHSGIDQFEKALLLQDPIIRNNAIQHAAQTLHTGLQKIIFELKSRIAEAPSPDNSILYHLAPWHNKTKDASKIMNLAQESFYAILMGIKTLAECYSALGETKAANKILSDYFDKVMACNIEAAAEKARLIEFSNEVPPQAPWEMFLNMYPTAKKDLASFYDNDIGKDLISIEIEFKGQELGGELHENMS